MVTKQDRSIASLRFFMNVSTSKNKVFIWQTSKVVRWVKSFNPPWGLSPYQRHLQWLVAQYLSTTAKQKTCLKLYNDPTPKSDMQCNVLAAKANANVRLISHACLHYSSSLWDYALPIFVIVSTCITPFIFHPFRFLCPSCEGNKLCTRDYAMFLPIRPKMS